MAPDLSRGSWPCITLRDAGLPPAPQGEGHECACYAPCHSKGVAVALTSSAAGAPTVGVTPPCCIRHCPVRSSGKLAARGQGRAEGAGDAVDHHGCDVDADEPEVQVGAVVGRDRGRTACCRARDSAVAPSGLRREVAVLQQSTRAEDGLGRTTSCRCRAMSRSSAGRPGLRIRAGSERVRRSSRRQSTKGVHACSPPWFVWPAAAEPQHRRNFRRFATHRVLGTRRPSNG